MLGDPLIGGSSATWKMVATRWSKAQSLMPQLTQKPFRPSKLIAAGVAEAGTAHFHPAWKRMPFQAKGRTSEESLLTSRSS